MPVCPNCGSRQPDGTAFCDECGARLGADAPLAASMGALVEDNAVQYPPTALTAARCSACGTPLKPDGTFCERCGAPVGAAKVPATAAAVAASPAQAAIPASPSVAEITADALACCRCGARLEPGSKFCDMCGAPARAGAPPVPRSRPALTPPPVPASSLSAQPAPAVSPSPAPHSPGTAIPGYLVAQGTNTTLRFPPGKIEIIVGRADEASGTFPDVDLSGYGGDEGGVSRQHARIFVRGSQVLIEDLHSTNRTYVNQQRLVPGQPHPLRHGDQVRCGQVRLNFYST